MTNKCTEIQAVMLNPVAFIDSNILDFSQDDFANLALRMLRAHCEETADKTKLADGDIRCTYDAATDEYRLADGWSAGKWTSKYNSFFDDIWFNCNVNYKRNPQTMGTAGWVECRALLKDLFTATEDYCPEYFDVIYKYSFFNKNIASFI